MSRYIDDEPLEKIAEVMLADATKNAWTADTKQKLGEILRLPKESETADVALVRHGRRSKLFEYESPIKIIQTQMLNNIEEQVMKAVEAVNVTVDKDELIKALKYDRKQYLSGYAAAVANMLNLRNSPQELWDRNLEKLKAGFYGPIGDSKTLFQYWQAQAAADYPGARENVMYFAEVCKETEKTK